MSDARNTTVSCSDLSVVITNPRPPVMPVNRGIERYMRQVCKGNNGCLVHQHPQAWKNSQGKLMAESIYWSNGNIGMTPREGGEVGEGWFVVVSKDGLKQMALV